MGTARTNPRLCTHTVHVVSDTDTDTVCALSLTLRRLCSAGSRATAQARVRLLCATAMQLCPAFALARQSEYAWMYALCTYVIPDLCR